ncbi:hypothetical protein EB796_005881 [Bugula neritina]|uniref:Uncharacterized protein n=1 Tax=Bugula neritina TaxID=10212 RepID=A0A7J7KD01_BUGNE|nr:hypothetical protein EB796_005881 [Bugula neritina]
MNQNEVLKFTQILTSVSYRDEEGNVLTELKKCLPFISFIEERYRLLCEHEVIHWAAERGYTDTIKSLLDSVSVEQKVELLKIQNDDVEQKVELFKIQDVSDSTAIHSAALGGHTDIIKCLLDGVSVDQKVELFKATNRVAIHCAAHGGHTDIIKFLLDGVSVDQKIELLEILDISDNTAIHCAAQGGHTDIIKCLLDAVSVEQKVELLKIQNRNGNTVIQEAAKANQTEILALLQSQLTAEQQLKLFNITNHVDRIPSDVGVDKEIFEPQTISSEQRADATSRFQDIDPWEEQTQQHHPLQSLPHQPISTLHWQLSPPV